MIDDDQNDDLGEDGDSSVSSGQDQGELENDPQFEQPLASPSITGEQDPSGSSSDSESMDIDEELAKVGLKPERSDEED